MIVYNETTYDESEIEYSVSFTDWFEFGKDHQINPDAPRVTQIEGIRMLLSEE